MKVSIPYYVVYIEKGGEKYYLAKFNDKKLKGGMVSVNHSATFSTDKKSAVRFDEFHAQWTSASYKGSKVEMGYDEGVL